jgi:hypothetical protein
MLDYELTRHGAGVRLWGDYGTLKRLHGVIHRLVEESHLIEEKDGFVLGLAYDIRKAYERQRSIREQPESTDNPGTQYGVEVVWPLLLIQAGLLRHAMTYLPTGNLEQAVMYELEYVIESALRSAVPATAPDILHAAQRAVLTGYPAVSLKLDSRCIYFLKLGKRQRFAALLPVMQSFDDWYEILAERYPNDLPGNAIPLEAFMACEGLEWPDFNW